MTITPGGFPYNFSGDGNIAGNNQGNGNGDANERFQEANPYRYRQLQPNDGQVTVTGQIGPDGQVSFNGRPPGDGQPLRLTLSDGRTLNIAHAYFRSQEGANGGYNPLDNPRFASEDPECLSLQQNLGGAQNYFNLPGRHGEHFGGRRREMAELNYERTMQAENYWNSNRQYEGPSYYHQRHQFGPQYAMSNNPFSTYYPGYQPNHGLRIGIGPLQIGIG